MLVRTGNLQVDHLLHLLLLPGDGAEHVPLLRVAVVAIHLGADEFVEVAEAVPFQKPLFAHVVHAEDAIHEEDDQARRSKAEIRTTMALLWSSFQVGQLTLLHELVVALS
jgi:hypothetical protein